MLKEKLLKRIFIVAIIVTLVVAVALAIASYWSYSLLTGWLFGAGISILTFFIKGWVMKNFFQRNKTKTKAFIASMVNTLGFLLIFAASIFIILAIDYWYIGKTFFVENAGLAGVLDPINLFSFIAGIHVIMFSIFISHYIGEREEKKETISENI